jgi:hypothetical protein
MQRRRRAYGPGQFQHLIVTVYSLYATEVNPVGKPLTASDALPANGKTVVAIAGIVVGEKTQQ